MTKTEHEGTGSVMNNLSSYPHELLALPRRGAPTNYYQISRVAWGYSHGNTHFCPMSLTRQSQLPSNRSKDGNWVNGTRKCQVSKEMPVFTYPPWINSTTFFHSSHCLLIYISGRVFPVSPCLTLVVPNLTNLYSSSILHQIPEEKELWSEPTLGSENTNLIVH